MIWFKLTTTFWACGWRQRFYTPHTTTPNSDFSCNLKPAFQHHIFSRHDQSNTWKYVSLTSTHPHHSISRQKCPAPHQKPYFLLELCVAATPTPSSLFHSSLSLTSLRSHYTHIHIDIIQSTILQSNKTTQQHANKNKKKKRTHTKKRKQNHNTKTNG